MLRITVHNSPQAIKFQLEGSLSGPWLQELRACWENTIHRGHPAVYCVDLAGVTFVDDAGKACLTDMFHHGAQLLAADCLTKAIVAEIQQSSSELPNGLASSQSPCG